MKNKGSAMVFAIVLVAAMTAGIVATLSVTTNALQMQRGLEDRAMVRNYFDGVVDRVVAEFGNGTLALPAAKVILVGTQSCTVNVTDNSANIPHSMLVDMTTTVRGRSFNEARVVASTKVPSPFYYALFVNNGFSATGILTAGAVGNNGDVYGRGNITLLGLSNTINGNLESTGTVLPGAMAVTGSVVNGASQVTMPAVVAANYQAAASQVLGNSINGFTFAVGGGNYPILYRAGDLAIRGTFRNKGCIFVDGNVTMSNTMSYFDANSRLSVIATGNISFSRNGVGYFYGNGLTTPLGGVTNARGGFVFQSASILGPLTVSNDPAVWLDSSEGTKLRLPGFWP